jgi:hypothetical protein
MLATSGTHVPTEAGWSHEVKWDGVRVLADTTRSGATRLLSRNENPVTVAWPELNRSPLGDRDLLQMLSVPAPAASFWVRLYLRSSVDIGQSEHNSYYQAMTGDGEPNAGDNVEVSEQYCQVVLNLHDDVVVSTGGTAACGSGVPPLAKDTWHCMETFFDGTNGGVQVYADGAKIIDKSGWTKLSFKTFSFGYLGFHGPARTVWVDDVAVATTRVGCQ